MKTKNLFLAAGLFVASATFVGCSNNEDQAIVSHDNVFKTTLSDVRLGDGVPLNLQIAVRWKIEDTKQFYAQFARISEFDSLILRPRQLELASNVSNTYQSVDSVFTVQRQQFISDIKSALLENLGEEGVTIKEIIVSNIGFPTSFTAAMENVALAERQLQRIRQQNIVDLEKAEADKKTAHANGEVQSAQALADAKLQKIKAETEKTSRQNELAMAETKKQVTEMQAHADAKRQEIMDKQEIKKKKDLNALEVDQKRQFQLVELEKESGQYRLEIEQQLEMAKLCQANPVYASYMVNKELASKVQIAVLPSGGDNSNMFGDLLKHGMVNK